MMRLAIATRADKSIEWYSKYSHILFRQYAFKCKADFIVLSHEPPVITWDKQKHFRITKLYDFLANDYDRILYLDSDMVISSECPNLFDVVPEDMIGSTLHDMTPRQDRKKSCQEKMALVQQEWGDIGWKEGMVITGVFLVSKMHKDIFLPFEGKYWTKDGADDIHLTYMIHKLGFKVFPFSQQYQLFGGDPIHELMVDRPYFVHYAGKQKQHKIIPHLKSEFERRKMLFA